MAAESGTESPDVMPDEELPVVGPPQEPLQKIVEYYGEEVREDLRKAPWSFHFFQAVRLLERLENRKPVGRFDNPQDEAVRFSCNPALVFPPSEIHSLDWPEDGQPKMSVNFMGLIGQLGLLPLPYTE